MIEVSDADAAVRLRLLGSPTVRVNGCDIESGVAQRHELVLACRFNKTESGLSGRLNERRARSSDPPGRNHNS
jgi:hypothetical protein